MHITKTSTSEQLISQSINKSFNVTKGRRGEKDTKGEKQMLTDNPRQNRTRETITHIII